MRKKHTFLKIFIISFILIFINGFIKTYAKTKGTVYINCDKEIINIDEEIEISINIDDFKTSAYTIYIYYDNEKMEYISEIENINVKNGKIIYVWYDEQGGNNLKSGELIKIKFRAKEKGIATFSINGEFFTEKAQKVETEFKEKQIQIGKEETKLEKQEKEEIAQDNDLSNSNLQNLRLNIEGLVPSFDKNINKYYLTVKNEVENIEILAKSENKEAEVLITGNENLKEGLNLIEIKVISQDKTNSNSYFINVTKTSNIEFANTNLETLAIQNTLLYPIFDTDVTNYNAEISNSEERVNLLAIPEDEEATVEITKEDILKEGNNEIRILVIARNGYTKKEYIINVYKRNAEEEKLYNKEQEINVEKLNEIYNTIKTSNNKIEKSVSEEGNNKNNILLFFVIFIIVMIICFVKIYKIKKNHK